MNWTLLHSCVWNPILQTKVTTWPGKKLVLRPPPLDDEGDVEAEDKGERDALQVLAAVEPHLVQQLF